MKIKKYVIWIMLFLNMGIIFILSKQIYIKNEVINLPKDNLYFSIYINDTISNTIPDKNDGYYFNFEKSYCTEGAEINWNWQTWVPTISNLSNTKTKCNFYFDEKYTEDILNGTDPILSEELIPINISDTGVVTRANLSKEWYNYGKKQWANAIILNEENTANLYSVESVIPESAIESYFVWIPKYRYQLWDLGFYEGSTSFDSKKAHTIPVIFGDYDTLDSVEGECATPMMSGESGACSVGDYMTHPAFLSFDSKGMWVGNMEESKIKSKFKEKYLDLTDEDIEEIYQDLIKNDMVPSNEEQLLDLFAAIDLIGENHLIDDSDDMCEK